jgi:predicted RNA binding protein YcfA (HicA-like mRNA interferase family)
MSTWSSTGARRVLVALLRMGWRIKRHDGSHRVLSRPGWPDFVFAFHDAKEIGPRMLAWIVKRTGLQPEDLWRQGCHYRHLIRAWSRHATSRTQLMPEPCVPRLQRSSRR